MHIIFQVSSLLYLVCTLEMFISPMCRVVFSDGSLLLRVAPVDAPLDVHSSKELVFWLIPGPNTRVRLWDTPVMNRA